LQDDGPKRSSGWNVGMAENVMQAAAEQWLVERQSNLINVN
jgi:hypothetical protein